MKKFIEKVFCLSALAIGLLTVAKGQNIAGDTIFVNAEAEVAIKFPARLSNFYTSPNNAPYNLKSLSSGLTVNAKSEDTKPAFLYVTEGGRTHHFVVAFKKDINYDNDAELFLDYGTVKKLDQHVKQMSSRKQSAPLAGAMTVGLRSSDTVVGTDQSYKTGNYYALLEEGDKKMKQGFYKEAKLIFENAHNQRTEDLIPIRRLEEINDRLNGKQTLSDEEANKKYIDLTEIGKTNFDQKKLKEAQEAYQQALVIKPRDLYASHQLEKINQLLREEIERKERLRLGELYKTHMTDGEKALKSNKLTEARIAFEQALVITPGDIAAQKKITAIEEKEKLLRQHLLP